MHENSGGSSRRLRRTGIALAVASALVLTGCSTTSSPDESAQSDSLTIGVSADPRSLLPTSSTVQAEVTISEQIVEKLFEYSDDGTEFEPRLGTDWEQISPTTVRVNLREDVTFTNGEEFNADSAKLSIEHLIESAAYSSFSTMLDHVEVVDSHTIDVVSGGPSGQIIDALAYGSFQLPFEYFQEVGEDGFGTAPIGTGPYLLDEWLSGDKVIMTANEDYWDGAPAIKSLTWQVYPDKAAQVAALQSGSIDLMTDVPVGSHDVVDQDPGIQLVTRDSNRVFYLAFSELSDSPLKDQKVRQALLHAIDVQSIIDNQLGGRGTALHGQVLPPNFVGYNDELKATPYDPELAAELLADAGYPDGFEFTFKYSSGRYAQDREIGQAVADQLAQIGVTAKQEVLESGAFLTQLTSLELNDMYFMGALTPPDGHMMYQQYRTGAVYSYYSNAKADELLDASMTVVDPKERASMLKKVGQIFHDDPAYIPLFQGTDAYGVAEGVNFTPRATQFIDVTTITRG